MQNTVPEDHTYAVSAGQGGDHARARVRVHLHKGPLYVILLFPCARRGCCASSRGRDLPSGTAARRISFALREPDTAGRRGYAGYARRNRLRTRCFHIVQAGSK